MSTAASPIAPYAPSALNRVYRAIERLPGGGWWVYPLLFVALVAYYEVSLWATGSLALGSLATAGIAGMAYGPYTIAASHYILGVADRAARRFQPASGLSDQEFEVRRYELVTLPSGRLWIAFLIGAVAAAGSVLFAAPDAIAPYGGTTSRAVVVLGPAALFGYMMFPVVIYQSLRQLRLVERLHREATAIDMFDPGPIHAFSRLTMQIGLAFVFVGYYSLTATASFQVGNPVALATVGASILIGIACFIVPLLGIHERLGAEKELLVRGVNLRAQALQAELYQRVDARDLTAVKEVTDALGGIAATREQISKLPTWPWPPQVLRGFITAIVLPVIIYVLSRYVGAQAHLG